MVKLIIVDKEKLKISAKEYEKRLRKDKITAKMLDEWDRQVEEALRKLKEEE